MNNLVKAFDYSLVDQEQEMKLREISTRLKVRVQRTAEEMLAMGADLREAKVVVKERGDLFTEWCESEECPVSWWTAKRLISVNEETEKKKLGPQLFINSFEVLAHVTQTRDEDIRQALLDHIEKEAEEGKKVNQKEITALKKALKEEKVRADNLEDAVFSADKALSEIKTERDAIHKKKEQFVKDLIEADKARKALDKELKEQRKRSLQEVKDAQEVFEEQLSEMREEIKKEEASKPKTSEEIKRLKKEEEGLRERIADSARQLREIEAKIKEDKKVHAVRDRVLGNFRSAGVRFVEDAVAIAGASEALRQIPMTTEIRDQVELLLNAAKNAVDALQGALYVDA